MIDFDNTIGKSFNNDFCQYLEYHLSRTFLNANVDKFKYFWCDGIEIPEKWDKLSEDFNESKQITTSAWLGTTGQDKYQLVIKLGDISLERCGKGLNINDCLPDDQSLDWVDIDPTSKTVILKLL